jgi:hypothetical protein
MDLNIRKERDYNEMITFKSLWMKEQFQRLRKIYTKDELSKEEIIEILLEAYSKRRLVEGRLYNNRTNDNEVMNQEQFIDLFLNRPYILSGYAALYENQDNSINIGSAALEFLLSSRKKYKKLQEQSEYGSDEYLYYKILQLTFKVLANSYYGILGERNSVFYNSHVQNSITMTGQDLTTTAIITLENFLADNVDFNDFDDVIRYINYTLAEKYSEPILKYLDKRVRSKEDLMTYLLNKTRFMSTNGKESLEKVLDKLDLNQTNILYYKNRILDFVDDTWGRNMLLNLTTFKYTEAPEEGMKEALNEFKKVIIDFCYSDLIFDDRFKRVVKDARKNIIASDTDSVFINFNNYILKTTKDLGLDVGNEEQQMTVMNIYIDIVTEALHKTFDRLTGNLGLLEKYKPLINMKSEFTYKRIMTTRNKKNYSGIITAELGKLIKPVLDIKGLSIRKTNVPKKLRKQFTEILTDDVLKAKEIKLKEIINKFDDLGTEVEASVRKGELLYSLPKSIEVFDKYKDPSAIEPVRGAIIWNALEPEDQIIPPEKVNMLKLKAVDKNDPDLLKMRLKFPDKYNAIMKIVFNEGVQDPKVDISRFGFNAITIPKSVEKIPEYLLPLIDYRSMVNSNISNGYIILESLGVYCDEVKTTKYKSNIIEI